MTVPGGFLGEPSLPRSHPDLCLRLAKLGSRLPGLLSLGMNLDPSQVWEPRGKTPKTIEKDVDLVQHLGLCAQERREEMDGDRLMPHDFPPAPGSSHA